MISAPPRMTPFVLKQVILSVSPWHRPDLITPQYHTVSNGLFANDFPHTKIDFKKYNADGIGSPTRLYPG